jgi:hypothetical protein
MTEEEAVQLQKENQEVRERLSQVEEQLRVALARIEELENQQTAPPAFVKANVKKNQAEEKQLRKKRAAEHNHGRPRSAPTQIVEHRIVTCPECQLRLGGISLARVQEVIDVPPPPPVEVIHHRIFKGWCAQCQKWHEAPVDLQTEVLGHRSRAGEIVKQLIGNDFQGVLGSDFYAGYNIHQGLHQRGFVHYLRDIHKLKEQFPQHAALLTWAKQVKAIYDDAVSWAAQDPDPHLSPRKLQQVRVTQQHAFEQQLWALCQPYVKQEVPQQTLCKRVERFLPELFVFVAIPGVPAHNNLAERSVRPLVLARKISGGTRSPKGSQTRMGLASLLGTWMAQGLNPFSQCLALLTQPNPFVHVQEPNGVIHESGSGSLDV